MYTEEDIEKYKVWYHPKKGGTYYIIGVSTSSTNGPTDGVERVVVYFSITYQCLRHRKLEEFLDGRFTPVLPRERAEK